MEKKWPLGLPCRWEGGEGLATRLECGTCTHCPLAKLSYLPQVEERAVKRLVEVASC